MHEIRYHNYEPKPPSYFEEDGYEYVVEFETKNYDIIRESFDDDYHEANEYYKKCEQEAEFEGNKHQYLNIRLLQVYKKCKHDFVVIATWQY